MEKFKDPKLIIDKIDTLKKDINEANFKYYVLESSDISDSQYDSMLKELINFEKENPDLITSDSPTQRVGAPPSKTFGEVVHKNQMLSLSNVFSLKELINWKERCEKYISREIKGFVLEEKIDGLAISLTYIDGILNIGATRGNGNSGENITNNLKTIKSIPLKILDKDIPKSFEIRGEVFFPKNKFQEFNKEREGIGLQEYSNTRNAASGALRQLDSSETAKRPLDAFFYSVGNPDDFNVSTHDELLKKINNWGFKINNNSILVEDFSDLENIIEDKIASRDNMNYSIDGLVLKVNNIKDQIDLGATAKDPRWATAYKLPSIKKITVVNYIKISLGRTGVVTPYAELEEVDLDGVKIKSASLHNIEYIDSKDIRIGDEVVIERAGDVIPQIIEVSKNNKRTEDSKKFTMPENCPVCNSKLFKDLDDPFTKCLDSECDDQIKRALEHFSSKNCVEIEGLGEGIINILFENKLVNSITDLYNLTYKELIKLEGFQDKSANNLLNSISISKKVMPEKLLHGLGIPHVGSEISELLLLNFKNINKIFDSSKDDILEIDGIGPKIYESLKNWIQKEKNKILLENLEDIGFEFNSQNTLIEGKLNSLNICVTGELEDFSRQSIKQLIKDNGGKFQSGVSSKTNILVSGVNSGSKLKKAQELGIEILTEKEFIKKLEENNG